MKNTSVARLHVCVRDARDIRACELGMNIIDGTTVLAETDRDSVIFLSMIALARENHTFTSNRHLMDESLITECINDAIERREIHSWLSFFSDEFLLQIGEGDTWRLTEKFDEAFARFCDTSDRHKKEVRIWCEKISRDADYSEIFYNANVCDYFFPDSRKSSRMSRALSVSMSPSNPVSSKVILASLDVSRSSWRWIGSGVFFSSSFANCSTRFPCRDIVPSIL